MINIAQVFNCVIPYIHDVDDRNSISLVCRTLYKLDGITRKRVTVYVQYSPDPYRLNQRFPFIESLSLKGFLLEFPRRGTRGKLITTWVKEIAVKFTCLKELQFRGLTVTFEDLVTLARTRGKDLRVLKISKCYGCWEHGLVHVGKYCNQLRTLCLDGWGVENINKQGKWLHELAMCNTVLESLHCKFKYDKYEVEDLTLLVRKCSKSLVSLRIQPCSLSLLGDAFRQAVRLEDISGAYNHTGEDYSGFKLPPNMCCFGISDLPVTALQSLLPLANQLKELNLQCMESGPNCVCFLIKRCPNLEVLYTKDNCGDTGLQVIVQFCKKLRKLTHDGWVTDTGLIALAEGCNNLEHLKIILTSMSNEAMECVGTHLKNLLKFSVISYKTLWNRKPDVPLDNGIRAMLMGCSKLERLDMISLSRGGLTDVDLGYIGKYGRNLKHLSLDCIGESDVGLVELSKGCPKLRKLRMTDCPFSEQAITTFMLTHHPIRFICVEKGYKTVLRRLRPDFEF